MPFKFQWLCELLEELHNNRRQRATTAARSQNPDHRTILSWFNKYDHKIERTGKSAVAFLSSVFPERRVDRVYNLQEKRLSPLFGRALGLGSSRAADLNRWRQRDGDDFPTCVERVMRECEFDIPLAGREVTLEEIDAALHQIAAKSPFSSPAVKTARVDISAESLLRPILLRLQSSEAKWFVRLMFKSFGCLQIPEYLTMKQFHFMLPDLLTIQNSFDAAIKVLEKPAVCMLPPRPNKQFEQALRPLVAREVIPDLGTMIRRQPYHKARSIKHCCNIVNKRQMSIERKYDGEYCQIHIDMSKGRDCLQIFSKSGKDSTNDRLRLHGAIKDSLRLDLDGCKIRDRCVIEGELLVWSSSQKQILPFHKIRKHVRHGGSYIGTAQDSPVKPDEQLMIVYYDLLMLDGKLLLNEPHTMRRQHLKGLVRTIEGRSIIGERRIISFSSSRASAKLREAFAHSITEKWEGLVLKACDEAFFSFNSSNHGIKLKKDYIKGLADSADLCLIGGRRDARVEQEIGLGPLRWTSFHVGCLTNKADVLRFNAKPCIKIIDEITTHSMPDSELLDLNRLGHLLETPFLSSIEEYDVLIGPNSQKGPTELFKQPFVVEIIGAGFERLQDSTFYTLRFPRKIDGQVKIQTDRSLTDTVDFAELQKMAEQSMELREAPDSQEDIEWIEKLIRADGKNRNTQDTSQSTVSARTPQSAATMSISPVHRRNRIEPWLYVRADTEDRDTPERESLTTATTTSGSRRSPVTGVPRQGLQLPVVIESSRPVLLDNAGVYNTSNTSPLQKRHVQLNCQTRGHKRSEDCLDSLTTKQIQNKHRRLTFTREVKRSEFRMQPQPPVVIDLTSPGAKENVKKRPLVMMDSHSKDPTLACVTDLALPTSAPLLPRAVISLSQVEVNNRATGHRTITTQSSQQSSQISSLEPDYQSQTLANISRRHIMKVTSNLAQIDGAEEVQLQQEQSTPLPIPPVSSAVKADTRPIAADYSRKGHSGRGLYLADLPTPASSDEACHGMTGDTNTVAKPVTAPATTPETPIQQPEYPPFKLTGPMFISDSLYNFQNKTSRGVNDMLKGLRTSYTFLVDQFLDQIENSASSTSMNPTKRHLHIILINFRDIEGAKKDIEEVMYYLIFQSKRVPPPGTTATELQHRLLESYSNTILVFDYKLLTKCEGGELNMNILKALKGTEEGASMFAGVVKIDKRRLQLGREPKFLLLTDWTWAG